MEGAVDESVHNGVGDGLVCQGTIPHTDRKLCGDGNCLFLCPSFIHDFIQVQTGYGLQRFKSEIVQNQKIGFLQIANQLFIAAVAAPDRQVQEQPAHFVTADGHARPAGFPPKGADQIGLDIRPFVVGRKNWMFCDTTKGAEASALCYSVLETAKANGLNVYLYLVYLMTEMPKAKVLDDDVLERCMPWSPTIPKWCRQQ